MSKKWRKSKPIPFDTPPALIGDIIPVPVSIAASASKEAWQQNQVEAESPAILKITGASEHLQIEAASEGNKLRKFSMTAYTGAAMHLAGFFSPVVVDLEGMTIPAQARPILKAHDHAQIVGHTDAINVSSQRLKLSGVISGVGEAAQEVVALAANGFPWQASIGASIEKSEFVEAGQSVKVNGRNFMGPITVARKTTLGEVSFVAVGADPNTAVSVAAKKPEQKMNDFEKWATQKGFDVATLTDGNRTAIEAMWHKETEAVKPNIVVQSTGSVPIQATVTAPAVAARQPSQSFKEIIEAKRIEEAWLAKMNAMITAELDAGTISADSAENLAMRCINEKWDENRLNLEIEREKRPKIHAGMFVRNESVESGEVIEAAVCIAGQLPNIEKHYGARTLEAAHKKYRGGGLGLGELILTFARRGGYHGLTLQGGLRSALQAAFHGEIRASITSPSTYSLPGILSNVANKFLAAGFNAVDDAWRMITSIRSVRDFKQISSYSLTGGLTYAKVAPGGELQHGTLAETTYTNQADTYGRLLAIDRRDFINDDLGALTQAGTRLGRGGAIQLNIVFWTEFLNNSSFFTAGNNNVTTGAGSALSLTALAEADKVFRLQTDPDGNPLGIMPKKLLVPPAIRVTALNLMNSTTVVATTTANSPLPDQNAFAGAFDVVSSPYMQSAALTGNSATAWYLLADPNDLPVIETVFLNGQQSPTVETADMDFNVLGIALRGYHDFGVNLQEFRAGVRAAGA